METPTKFDLTLLADGRALAGLVEQVFAAKPTSCVMVGKGFYAHVYSVTINRSPDEIIVKCHQYKGRAQAEARQLEVLRRHALTKIPEVYALAPYDDSFPCEAILMELLPGINASHLDFPDQKTQAAFVDSVIENLQAWHSVHNENGFGVIGEPLVATWTEAYGAKIKAWRQMIHEVKHKDTVSHYVMGVVDRSADSVEAVFRNSSVRSCLVHSDYNAWNIMADPTTYRLTGVIDPIDAGWADPEIDLFHLSNSRPELGMLYRYLRDAQVDDSFWLRYCFYRFWDDVKHYLRMGWYKEARFADYGRELIMHMDQCL